MRKTKIIRPPSISRLAIKEFRARELSDFDWMKELPPGVIDRMLEDLDPTPRFITQPYLHQKVCTLIAAHEPRFFFQLDMGTGKTKVVLDSVRYRYDVRKQARVLVLVEFLTTMDEWVQQRQQHAPDIPIVPLYGSSRERYDAIERIAEQPLVLCPLNIGGLVAMTTYQEERYNKRKKKKEKVTVIDGKAVAHLRGIFDSFIIDESTSVMNHLSLQHRVARQLTSDDDAMVYLLSGTPFGRDPQALWSQFFVCDRGETLGSTLGLFRAAYFKEVESPWKQTPDYVFKEECTEELHRVMRHHSIWYESDADLPQQVRIQRHGRLPADAEREQKQIIGELRAAGSDVKRLESIFTRLRQVASGFIRVKDQETGTTADVPLKTNPKLDLLLAILEELPKSAKLVVFHEFIYSGQLIGKALKERKIDHVRLWSQSDDRPEALRRFREDPKCRVLVVNNTIGSKGLNLQVANYTVFYETPTSVINRRQAEKRTHRDGQKADRVFYYDLIISGSVDDKLLKYQAEGASLFDALVKGEETLD